MVKKENENILYIGIDNGVTGTIGMLYRECVWFYKTPVYKTNNYQKPRKVKGKIKQKKVTLLDGIKVIDILEVVLDFVSLRTPYTPTVKVFMERPMVNPTRFVATASALRCLGAWETLLVNYGITFVDSKEWQKKLLPGVKGSEELKKASMELGIKTAPQYEELMRKHGDADGLLIAVWARDRENEKGDIND